MKYIQETREWSGTPLPEMISEETLFLDIETTGFSAGRGVIYLIGCCHLRENRLCFLQWFAETPGEEGEILRAADQYAAAFSRVITFNGDTFDLPFLKKRAELLGLDIPFLGQLESRDLFRRIRPLRDPLDLPDCRQKTVEAFLGLPREDRYTGGDLIAVYRKYVLAPEPEGRELLLLHNREDVLALPRLLPVLSYARLLAGEVSVCEVLRKEETKAPPSLVVTLRTDLTFPQPMLWEREDIRLFLQRDHIRLTIPALSGELRFFFANYRDYYYLPAEDMAVHRSVAAYVEKDYRQRAKPETAYIRKEGQFFRIPSRLPDPLHRFSEDLTGPPFLLLADCPEGTAFWERFLRALFHGTEAPKPSS